MAKKMQTKVQVSPTKQFLLTIAQHLSRGLVNVLDVQCALLSPRDRMILTHGGIDRVREYWARDAHRQQRALLEKLKERAWIRERRIGNRVGIALTEKGRAIVLKEQMRCAAACARDECIIVIFDVPESERHARKQLRRFLKQCHFVQLQKSVWIHRCDVLDAMKEFIQDTKSERWVRVFRAHDVRLN